MQQGIIIIVIKLRENVDPSPFVYPRHPQLTLRKAAIPLMVTPTPCQLCLLRFNVVHSVFSYVMSARFLLFFCHFLRPTIFFNRMRLSLQSGPPTTHTLGSFPGPRHTQRCTRSSSLDGRTPCRSCANATNVRYATPTHIASFLPV